MGLLTSMKDCVIFAALGPNPAPLIELVWKLARTGRFERFDIHVVVDKPGRHYLDLEVLEAGGALEQLRGILGADAIPTDPVVHEAKTDSQGLIDDDADAESLQLYGETVWSAARETIKAAGERPVVFGLTAGRRRTMTALESAVFQLQARPQDLMIDVRVTDARVEGGTGFFFPEQAARIVKARRSDELIDVSTVDVVLVELTLPKLRGLVPESALVSLEAAQLATQVTLADVAPPRLRIDLVAGQAWADERLIPLSTGKFVWYAYLGVKRAEGEGRVAVKDLAGFRAFLKRVRDQPWWCRASEIESLVTMAADDWDDDEDLKPWRSKTGRAIQEFVKDERPSMKLLVPEVTAKRFQGVKTGFQRLPLPSGFVTIEE